MKACKKFVSLLLTLCLVMSILPAAVSAADKAPTHVALGDSISTGYDVAEEERFTNIVATHYGLTEVNKAVNGFTATNLKDLLSTGELDKDLASASLITLTVGGNEMVDILCERIANIYNSKNPTKPQMTADQVIPTLSNLSGFEKLIWPGAYVVPALVGDSTGRKAFSLTDEFKAGLATYEKDLTASIQYIREKNSTAQLVVCTQFAPFKQFKGTAFDSSYQEVNKAAILLNNVIKKYAEPLNYHVADIHPLFDQSTTPLFPGGNSSNVADLSLTNVHPNADGHAVIAKVITDMNLTITAPLPFEPGVPNLYFSAADVSLADGTVKVKLNAMDGETSVIAAFHNDQGRMVGVACQMPAAGTTEITLSANLRSEAAGVTLYLLNGACVPLISAQTYPAA